MKKEMEGGSNKAFTAPGPARSCAYVRLIKLLQSEGWSYVLQDGDIALLGVGSLLQDYADALRMELDGTSACVPDHVGLTGICGIAVVLDDGTISHPLPIAEALGAFAK